MIRRRAQRPELNCLTGRLPLFASKLQRCHVMGHSSVHSAQSRRRSAPFPASVSSSGLPSSARHCHSLVRKTNRMPEDQLSTLVLLPISSFIPCLLCASPHSASSAPIRVTSPQLRRVLFPTDERTRLPRLRMSFSTMNQRHCLQV